MELTDVANFPVKLQVCAKKLFANVSITSRLTISITVFFESPRLRPIRW